MRDQRPDQKSCNKQKCWPSAAELPCRQVGSILSCCARGGGLGCSSGVQDHQWWIDKKFCAGFWQVPFTFCQFAAKLQPLTQWRPGLFPLPAHSANPQVWVVFTASLLPLVSPVAAAGQCWCDDQPGFLLTLLIFHYPTTLFLTKTDHFLFPSGTLLFGLQLEDRFRVSTLAPSLLLFFTLNFTSSSFSSCQLHFMKSASCRAALTLSPLWWFLENPLLFIIVLLWKLAVKGGTLQYLQRHGK